MLERGAIRKSKNPRGNKLHSTCAAGALQGRGGARRLTSIWLRPSAKQNLPLLLPHKGVTKGAKHTQTDGASLGTDRSEGVFVASTERAGVMCARIADIGSS